jgi:putative membrane protein
MKHFTPDFQTALWDTIAQLERQSVIEVVVVIKPRSDAYRDTPLWCGLALAWLTFTVMMFIPFVFGDYLLYVAPLLAFWIGFLLAVWIAPVQRLFIRRVRQQRSVEIMARAFFQKGGLRHTKTKIGTLIYCSILEKIVYVLPDRGAELAIPVTEWEQIRRGFQQIFQTKNPADALLTQLQACQPIFSQYLPPVPNDINELPDRLEVDL